MVIFFMDRESALQPCHPVIYKLEPVKNINNIDIFSCFSGPSSQATAGIVAWIENRHCEEITK
ncbi:hypothetical protein A8V33_00210 [Rickettsia sp. wb]|nr:hypothetical protein A8V33_00210 [Rickettsia sp. wb]